MPPPATPGAAAASTGSETTPLTASTVEVETPPRRSRQLFQSLSSSLSSIAGSVRSPAAPPGGPAPPDAEAGDGSALLPAVTHDVPQAARRGSSIIGTRQSSSLATNTSGQHPPRYHRLESVVKRKWRKKLLYLAACTRLAHETQKPPKRWLDGSKALLLGSKLNVLLACALGLPFVPLDAPAAFALASLALLPLAALLGDVTEKVAFHTSETLGGLLNATFGNATEALVSIFALQKGLVRVVQVSLLGSVLSNMLLVLGSAFVAAGMRVKIAHFNKVAATANTSLLLVAVLALLVPAMLVQSADSLTVPGAVDTVSRCCAVLMLTVYVAYLNFQLGSHSALFDESVAVHSSDLLASSSDLHGTGEEAPHHPHHQGLSFSDVALAALEERQRTQMAARHPSENNAQTTPLPASTGGENGNNHSQSNRPGTTTTGVGPIPPMPHVPSILFVKRSMSDDEDDEYVLDLKVALAWLALVTVAVALLSEVLTGSLEAFARDFKLNDAFVGFVLLPLVGNAAEHATAISMAYRSKMDLAIAVALGSSTQIALFVLPLMVIVAWAMREPLDLAFGSFETAVTALSVLIVASMAQMGDVHYLNGLCLVVAYVIIAISFLFLVDE